MGIKPRIAIIAERVTSDLVMVSITRVLPSHDCYWLSERFVDSSNHGSRGYSIRPASVVYWCRTVGSHEVVPERIVSPRLRRRNKAWRTHLGGGDSMRSGSSKSILLCRTTKCRNAEKSTTTMVISGLDSLQNVYRKLKLRAMLMKGREHQYIRR